MLEFVDASKANGVRRHDTSISTPIHWTGGGPHSKVLKIDLKHIQGWLDTKEGFRQCRTDTKLRPENLNRWVPIPEPKNLIGMHMRVHALLVRRHYRHVNDA